MPRGRERPRLGLAVAHNDGDQQGRIVESGAERLGDAVSAPGAFVDRSGRLRRAVAADAAGEREVLEKGAHALDVLGLGRVDLGVRALEIDGREYARRAVAGAGDEHRLEAVLVYEAIEVDVDEAQA